jgi:uncharacterized damage-inducible protein DinB
MSNPWLEGLRAHARYNRWMNEKLYSLCETLDDASRKLDRGAFFGSIHRTLNHILLADRVWMHRFTGDPERYQSRDRDGVPIRVTSLGQELYASFDELREQRARTDGDILAWTDALEEGFLTRVLSYATSSGVTMEHPGWWAVTHFFNHQTHHRGQVTTLMMQAGVDPGSTDLIAMLRDEAIAARA